MNANNIIFEKYKFQKNGKVWSNHKQDYLKGKKDRNGYTLLELSSKDGKFHTYKLHRVLAELYCEIPNGFSIDELEVDHIIPLSNGGSNEVSNLRWVTSKQNHNNPNTLINRSESMKNKESMSKVVEQYKNGTLIAEYPSTREIERQFGYDHKSISKCCRGITNTAYGYVWKYKKLE